MTSSQWKQILLIRDGVCQLMRLKIVCSYFPWLEFKAVLIPITLVWCETKQKPLQLSQSVVCVGIPVIIYLAWFTSTSKSRQVEKKELLLWQHRPAVLALQSTHWPFKIKAKASMDFCTAPSLGEHLSPRPLRVTLCARVTSSLSVLSFHSKPFSGWLDSLCLKLKSD